ncbi:MAG: DUF4838 domain-containing protein [Armatimonadetes bacterium]|nr:DUF4838 domain-containing protein [Candidatus Hippobium faecium]
MKKILFAILLMLLVSGLFAQDIKLVGIEYDGKPQPPTYDYENWYDITAKYEYPGKTDTLLNCFYGIGYSQSSLMGQILLKYCHGDGNIYIVKHGTWNEPLDMGKAGENRIMENDLVYVDLAKSKVEMTQDTVDVTYHLKFKETMKGFFNDIMYCEDKNIANTGFVPFNTVIIGGEKEAGYMTKAPKGWTNSLKPKGGKKFSFADSKTPLYYIVIPENATSVEEKAGSELKRYFDIMSGKKFNVIKDSEYKKGNFISIGKTTLSKKAPSYNKDLGVEGYAIDFLNNNICIFGGRGRGPINGVFSMLEEDFGCRFWTSKDEFVPKTVPFAQTVKSREFIPALDLRDPYIFEAWDPVWSMKNRTNAPNAAIPAQYGGSIKYHALVHTYATYFPPNVYFKDHPEYYSEINGVRTPTQLCNTNPDVVRLSIEKTKQIFRDHPNATITSVSPNDGRGFCDCENCKAMDEANGGRSGSYFYLVNEVAKGIRDEFPDKKILALAYLDYAMPPTNMKIEDNVVVQLCTDSHAWKYQFCFTTESDEFAPKMIEWGKSGAGVFIWDYVTSYVHMLVPMANMPVVRENMKFYIDNNAKGMMLQGTCYSNGGDMSDMRSWVWAKQIWDIDRDTKTLMKDFIYGYYRECAEPVWDYQMMLWDFWETNHAKPHKCGDKESGNPLLDNLMCSYAPDGPMFTEEFMARFWDDINKAEKLAEGEDMLWKIKKIKASLLYLELGQNVGYMTEFKDFKPGKCFRNGILENKEKYKANYDELMEICTKLQISSFSEQNAQSAIIEKWEAVFASEGVSVPTQAISNEWIFKQDKDNVGISEKWFSETKYFDKALNKSLADVTTAKDGDGCSRLRVDINAGWESQGYEDYNGAGWYFQKVKLDDSIKNANKIYLYFGGIDEEGWIYLNGELVCEHSVAATGKPTNVLWNEPVAIDVTDIIKKDDYNEIAVRVYDASGMGGVWKPVKIYGPDAPKTASDFAMLL